MSELVGNPDWSAYGGINLWVHSANATNEILTQRAEATSRRLNERVSSPEIKG
jgi:hypothetical protein